MKRIIALMLMTAEVVAVMTSCKETLPLRFEKAASTKKALAETCKRFFVGVRSAYCGSWAP